MVKRIDEKHTDVVTLKESEQKLNQLKKRLTEKERNLEELQGQYARETARSATERIAEQAASLLADGGIITITRDDVERLHNECAVLKAAITTQAQAVSAARNRVSKLLHEANRPQYIEIEKRIARAVQELALANEQEAKFFSELKAAGCSSIAFRPMAVNAVGRLSDSQSVASFHQAEVREFLPEAL
jgi:hypothetical protein